MLEGKPVLELCQQLGRGSVIYPKPRGGAKYLLAAETVFVAAIGLSLFSVSLCTQNTEGEREWIRCLTRWDRTG